MDVTRREWLGFASAAGALGIVGQTPAPGASARTEPRVNDEVVERIRAFATADLADKGLPGMLVALLRPDGTGQSLGIGLADRERRLPVTIDQLFQIGSISKSLVAMCLFSLVGRGRLDLGARVQSLLPEYPLPPEPITIAQLINHSSGLPNTIDSPFAAFPEGRLWTGFRPGSRSSYCNLGYALLGKVIERASGVKFAQALEAMVLRPIGMNRARSASLISDRPNFAIGYAPLRDDVPWLSRSTLAPAPWRDFDNAAGSVTATGADMVAYLRYFAELVTGRGGPVMPDALARRYAEATIDAPDWAPGVRYGNGFAIVRIDGRPYYHHTGGTLAFSSAFLVDGATGAGCFASVNVGGAGSYRPREVTEYALALLNSGPRERLPAVRRPKPPPPVNNPGQVTGQWIGGDDDFTIAERSGALFIVAAGREHRLAPAGKTYVTDHPALAPYRLVPEGEGNAFLRLGGRLYGRNRAPATNPTQARLAALAGRYHNPGSWDPRQTVYAIGDRVYLDAEPLMEAQDGSWRFADPDLVSERLWFERPANGVPQQLNISGTRYDRMNV